MVASQRGAPAERSIRLAGEALSPQAAGEAGSPHSPAAPPAFRALKEHEPELRTLLSRLRDEQPATSVVVSATSVSSSLGPGGELLGEHTTQKKGHFQSVRDMWRVSVHAIDAPGEATLIASDAQRSLQRNAADPVSQFTDDPSLPLGFEHLGVLDQSMRCMFSGCKVSVEQIADTLHLIQREPNEQGERWRMDVRTGPSGRMLFEIDVTRAEAPSVVRFSMRLYPSVDDPVEQPKLETVVTVTGWRLRGNRQVPASIETIGTIRRSNGTMLRAKRVLRVEAFEDDSPEEIEAACVRSMRLAEGEVAFDRSLRLRLVGGSRVFEVDAVRYMAPEPLWEHPGRDLAALVAKSNRIPGSAVEAQR